MPEISKALKNDENSDTVIEDHNNHIALELENVSHWYGTRQALKSVSLKINRNQTIGLLGQNGAGKSTLLKIIATIIPKMEEYKIVPSTIGYLPEVPALYDEMKVKEQLMYVGRLNNLSKKQVNEKLETMIEEFGLSEVKNLKCSKLSKGYKQRVGLLVAFLHSPEVVILDEPTAGLDPKQSEATRAIISRLSSRCTVILSSHNLREAQELCGEIVILDHGRVIESGTKEELSAKIVDSRRIRAKLKFNYHEKKKSKGDESNDGNRIKKVRNLINKIPGIREIENVEIDDSGSIALSFTVAKKDCEPDSLTSARFTENNFAIELFSADEVSVDEIYMTLISGKKDKV